MATAVPSTPSRRAAPPPGVHSVRHSHGGSPPKQRQQQQQQSDDPLQITTTFSSLSDNTPGPTTPGRHQHHVHGGIHMPFGAATPSTRGSQGSRIKKKNFLAKAAASYAGTGNGNHAAAVKGSSLLVGSSHGAGGHTTVSALSTPRSQNTSSGHKNTSFQTTSSSLHKNTPTSGILKNNKKKADASKSTHSSNTSSTPSTHNTGMSGQSGLTGGLSKGDFYTAFKSRLKGEPGGQLSPKRYNSPPKQRSAAGQQVNFLQQPQYNDEDLGEEKKQDQTPPSVYSVQQSPMPVQQAQAHVGALPIGGNISPESHNAWDQANARTSSWIDSMEPNGKKRHAKGKKNSKKTKISYARSDSDDTDLFIDEDDDDIPSHSLKMPPLVPVPPRPPNSGQPQHTKIQTMVLPLPPTHPNAGMMNSSNASQGSSRNNKPPSASDSITMDLQSINSISQISIGSSIILATPLPMEQFQPPELKQQASSHMQTYRDKLQVFMSPQSPVPPHATTVFRAAQAASALETNPPSMLKKNNSMTSPNKMAPPPPGMPVMNNSSRNNNNDNSSNKSLSLQSSQSQQTQNFMRNQSSYNNKENNGAEPVPSASTNREEEYKRRMQLSSSSLGVSLNDSQSSNKDVNTSKKAATAAATATTTTALKSTQRQPSNGDDSEDSYNPDLVEASFSSQHDTAEYATREQKLQQQVLLAAQAAQRNKKNSKDDHSDSDDSYDPMVTEASQRDLFGNPNNKKNAGGGMDASMGTSSARRQLVRGAPSTREQIMQQQVQKAALQAKGIKEEESDESDEDSYNPEQVESGGYSSSNKKAAQPPKPPPTDDSDSNDSYDPENPKAGSTKNHRSTTESVRTGVGRDEENQHESLFGRHKHKPAPTSEREESEQSKCCQYLLLALLLVGTLCVAGGLYMFFGPGMGDDGTSNNNNDENAVVTPAPVFTYIPEPEPEPTWAPTITYEPTIAASPLPAKLTVAPVPEEVLADTPNPTVAVTTTRRPSLRPSVGGDTTLPPSTMQPSTSAPSTSQPSTVAPSTLEPSTSSPTSLAPSSTPSILQTSDIVVDTVSPTALRTSSPTLRPTTSTPLTQEPTIVTQAPTIVTAPPTILTSAPTVAATTASPTSLPPTSAEPTSLAPTSQAPSTASPTIVITDAQVVVATPAPSTAFPTIAPTLQALTDAPTTSEPTTPSPTPEPTTSRPTLDQVIVLANLPDETWQHIAENPSSPQAQAFRWIVEDPNLNTYPQWRQEQRFSLVTTYYSWFDPVASSLLDAVAAVEDDNGPGPEVNSPNRPGGSSFSGGFDLPMRAGIGLNIGGGAQPNPEGIIITGESGNSGGGNGDDGGERVEDDKEFPDKGRHPEGSDGGRNLQQDLSSFLEYGSWLDYNYPECQWMYLHGNHSGESFWLAPLTPQPNPEEPLIPCNDVGVYETLEVPRSRDPTPGTVVDIYVASLPPEIGLLTDLTSIRMPNNKVPTTLEEFVPANLTQLTSLKELDFSQSNIQEWSPQAILRLPNSIEILDLSFNSMKGELFLELGLLMTSLRELYLMGNELRGTIPVAIPTWTRLQSFHMSGNQLEGNLPSEIGWLSSHLEVLSLSANKLQGTIPTEIGSLEQLVTLDLDKNRFLGFLHSEIGRLTNLEYLGLADNNLQGPVPTQLGQLTSLEQLRFSNNLVTGSVPSEIALLTGLSNFQAFGNALIGTVPTEIGSMSDSLYSLDLHDNALMGPIPSEVGLLTSVNFFYLYENMLSGTLPTELGLLGNMSYIGLESNRIAGSIPSEFGLMRELRYIHLSDNDLTSTIPSELGSLTRLKYLFLGRNQFTGEIPSELGLLTNLRFLDVAGRSTNLGGSVPAEVCALSDITIRVHCPSVACDCDCECA